MEQTIKHIIEDSFRKSNDGTAHFGEILQALAGAGVESYNVDYRTLQTTYYLQDDTALSLDMEPSPIKIGSSFDVEKIRAAIRGAQSGKIMYPEFKMLSQQAGCTGYVVWIAGRHVTYYGRKGETHVERFPD